MVIGIESEDGISKKEIQKMTNPLMKAFEELKREEQAKQKKKDPIFNVKKEKRLQYYFGWHKDDKAVTREEGEKQKKLC